MKYPNDPILEAREKTHGDFMLTASIAQRLKDIIHEHPGRYGNSQREVMDMICTKLARICSGDPDNLDHWNDIAGYARLIGSRGDNT